MSSIGLSNKGIDHIWFRFYINGDQLMALKKLSYKTESIVNIILNNTLKSARWIEGKPWVKIPQIHLAKILKCTTDCISLHICKLVKEGVLFREQFGAKEHDHTNYYSINFGILEDSRLKSFFNASITKKISTIYRSSRVRNINPSDLYISNSQQRINHDLASAVGDSDLRGSPALPPILEQHAKEEFPADISQATQAKPTIVQDMLRIWNEELERGDSLSRQLSRYLVASYQRKFGSLLEKWREYVRGLKKSAYVMGKLLKRLGNKLLSWALSFKVINRIFSGGFGVTLGEVLGVKPEQPSTIDDDATSPAEDHIDSLTETEACKEIRREVLTTYGETEYLSWFRRITLEESGSDILIKGLSFITDMVKRRYFMSNDRIIDAGEKYVSEDVVNKAEEERTQSELISEGYIGASRMRAALFHCRDLRLGR